MSQNFIHSTDIDGTLFVHEFLATVTDFDCWFIPYVESFCRYTRSYTNQGAKKKKKRPETAQEKASQQNKTKDFNTISTHGVELRSARRVSKPAYWGDTAGQ